MLVPTLQRHGDARVKCDDADLLLADQACVVRDREQIIIAHSRAVCARDKASTIANSIGRDRADQARHRLRGDELIRAPRLEHTSPHPSPNPQILPRVEVDDKERFALGVGIDFRNPGTCQRLPLSDIAQHDPRIILVGEDVDIAAPVARVEVEGRAA